MENCSIIKKSCALFIAIMLMYSSIANAIVTEDASYSFIPTTMNAVGIDIFEAYAQKTEAALTTIILSAELLGSDASKKIGFLSYDDIDVLNTFIGIGSDSSGTRLSVCMPSKYSNDSFIILYYGAIAKAYAIHQYGTSAEEYMKQINDSYRKNGVSEIMEALKLLNGIK